MNWRVYVFLKKQFADHRGRSLLKEWSHAGGKSIKKINAGQAYELSEKLSSDQVARLTDALLADPVTQDRLIYRADEMEPPKGARVAQVWSKPGVSDPVADTVREAARDLGINELSHVKSGHVFDFYGDASPLTVKKFCEDHLMNTLVQTVEVL